MATTDLLIAPETLLRRGRPDTERPRIDVGFLERALKASVKGDVRFDPASRAMYASDASNYRRIPLGVVIPETQEDVVRAVAACRAHGAPIVPRGGGTALAGQTVNEAVVLDFSKRMNRIVSVDAEARRARVELGVVCDELVEAVKPHGLTFGPRPATHSRCCFGGMLANNCGGMHAQRHGIAVHNVEALDVVLYDGTRMHLGWETETTLEGKIRAGGPEASIYARLRRLRDRYAQRIVTGYPRLPRRVSGYNLDELIPKEDGRFNLARIIVGSEGTLATMLEAELELIPDPPVKGVVVLGFRDVFHAADAVADLVDFDALAIEGIDERLVEQIEKKGGDHAEHLKLLCKGQGWLCVGVGGDTKDDVKAKIIEAISRVGRLVDHTIYLDPVDMKNLWDAREGALGATAFVPGEADGWPGWEDSAVPPEKLGGYLRELSDLYEAYDYHPALYGHFGMGLVHCRVPFGLESEPMVNRYRRFMNDAADLVVKWGGSLSGEHGDGQARGALLEKMFGRDLMDAMRELKSIFDPLGMMNPGKIVDAYPIDDHLRLWPDYTPAIADTHFRYPDDGGSFARATLRCVGVGICRRKESQGKHDVMCPSYMVTHEEKHSTRGRAHLLWEMMRGDGPIKDGWHDEGVKEALDLCLSCKGCKSDCPVGVDIATYKAEFLSHYYEGKARPRHAYAFGFIDVWARLAALAPGLANLVTQTPGLRAIAKSLAGVSQEAEIPPFASTTFRAEWRRRGGSRVHAASKVVLWPDTFNDHFHPRTAMAAAEVLEGAGYEVIVPEARVCCGRPLYDFGMLDRAKEYLERAIAVTKPWVEQGIPVVVLEPSCASVLRDELPNMLAGRDDAAALAKQTKLLAEILPVPGRMQDARKALVQGHCHHKAIAGMRSEKDVLHDAGFDVEVLEAGCCGMAGSFGFVSETRDVGVACGERALLPRVRDADEDAVVVADGFSCREQIRQHTDRTALHLAEVLAGYSEKAIALHRKRDLRVTMLRGAVAVAIAGTLAVLLSRRRR
jgi:FAD/FMN-containing dehydrogenase/Fe-S oxidoreductase